VFKTSVDPKLFLTDGAVGILPTDTVYGLTAKASDKEAVKRLYGFKPRENKPGTIIAADVEQLVELGLKRRYLKAVEQYWPGPVSVIIPCGPELEYLHLGTFGLAIRIPKDKQLSDLLKETGPLLTTSANLPDQPVSNNLDEAKKYFGDKPDFYIDGGDLSDHKASTIIKIVDDAVEVIRQGAVEIKN
jgi:L-threonylcarbamoyladenylate synthase